MSEGIGARVLRKEDKRFITGKGRYTDDIIEANQAYAAFVRSPHAHARIVSLDASAALAMEGVETVLTGPELVADGIGNIICGWGITSKDGTPMNMGAWSALATEKVRYVGDAVAIVVADS
jgi:carbon-monoxide dehydrogenase large subunit